MPRTARRPVRRKSATRLPTPKQRFALLQAGLDRINQGMTLFDSRLRMIAWNRRFFTMLDFPEELARVGVPFEAFMRYNAQRGEYGPGDVEEKVTQRVAAARRFEPHYLERSRPSGQIIAVRGEPLAQGGFVTIYTDITEQRAFERLIRDQNEELDRRVKERTAQLEKAQAALLQAQKMEAVGQLAGGLAHDFNNLLAIVLGNLASLRDRNAENAAVTGLVDPALQAAKRGVALVRRLLAFARRQPLEARPVDLGSLVTDTVPLLRHSIAESIHILTSVPARAVYSMVDPGGIESALLNLALNARDAIRETGEIRVDVSPCALDGENAREFEVPPGEYVRVGVRDSGAGMDQEMLAHAFEPFFTSKEFGSGSGLGLSMVYGFVRQSGGGIRIRSRLGEGTEVALVLPRASAPEENTSPPGSQVAAATTGSGLVMLVEDDPDVRRTIRRHLTEIGYSVIEADNGAEAAEMLANVADISVLVSDIVMPGSMSGRALAEIARARRPDLRILLISGYAQSVTGAPAEHGLPILHKPFTKEDLAGALAGVAQ